ncbi:NERD domain-containing protein [Rheinheimera aquimaris]|uniref:NERD domain-containing protein n=1 Tax=Rheinheimera aquimaris TaxID=412437 RepID=UPI001CFFA0C2|nr:NERD domain-containing protein [Rheinheimera aquimaris]MCB5213585.1 NERD domain-containing protein [Rheinheimera aquimaris]
MLPITAFSQKQYTEGACLLLQQQADRFAGQPNSRNYQDARRELNNHCQNPIPAPDKELNLTNIPVKTITVGNTKNTAATQPANPNVVVTAKPQPVKPTPSAIPKPADILKQLFAPVLALFGSLLAFLLLIVVVMGLLALFLARHGARIKGALAERVLHKVLVKELPASYQHYRNLVIPTEQGDLTEIDHLVVSAYGIFVIEVKNYRGWIFGGEKQPRWTVQRFRSKHQFMNPLHQNYKHTEAIKHVLGLNGKDSDAVHSIVAFSQRAEFNSQIPQNVMYIDLVGDYLQQFYQPCFDDEQVRQFTARLNFALASRKALSKLHLAQVKTQKAA